MNRFNYIVLIVAGCLLAGKRVFTHAQGGTGLDLEDDGYVHTKKLVLSGKKATLPPAVDLTPYCPTPRHQGEVQSCVGWATGYGALTITYAVRNNIRNRALLDERAFSALYIYEQIRQGDCQRTGARISDAMRLLQEKGNCLASQYDHQVESCDEPIPPSLHDFASQFRTTDFLRLFGQEDHPRDKVYRLQYALAQRKPVIVGMRIKQNFFKLDAGAEYWWPNIGDQTPAGGHAMVVIGYDHRRGAFKLMNSWGTSWGQGGFIWIKYREMAAFCKYAYIFQVEDDLDGFWQESPQQAQRVQQVQTRPLETLQAGFSFTYNPCGNSYCGNFSNAPVHRQGLVYSTKNASWGIGQQFQLRIENKGDDAYFYIFSQNPQGTISLHWPRPESFQNQVEELITPAGASIIVPGEQRAMRISQAGTNYLVLLATKKPLGNPAQLLAPLENSGDQLPNRLFQILRNHLVPAADLQLRDDAMEVSVQTRSGKAMVPLILRIHSNGEVVQG